jgi:hypothetical protein
MQVGRVTERDGGKQLWLTVRHDNDDFMIVHVISNEPVEWSASGCTLNLRPKLKEAVK